MLKETFYSRLKPYFSEEEIDKLEEYAVKTARETKDDNLIKTARNYLYRSINPNYIDYDEFNQKWRDITERDIEPERWENLREACKKENRSKKSITEYITFAIWCFAIVSGIMVAIAFCVILMLVILKNNGLI